jgi:hypothetical protein
VVLSCTRQPRNILVNPSHWAVSEYGSPISIRWRCQQALIRPRAKSDWQLMVSPIIAVSQPITPAPPAAASSSQAGPNPSTSTIIAVSQPITPVPPAAASSSQAGPNPSASTIIAVSQPITPAPPAAASNSHAGPNLQQDQITKPASVAYARFQSWLGWPPGQYDAIWVCSVFVYKLGLILRTAF